MKRAKVERSIVAVLFIAVLITFSFAQRDSKKIDQLYTVAADTGSQLYLAKLAASTSKDF